MLSIAAIHGVYVLTAPDFEPLQASLQTSPQVNSRVNKVNRRHGKVIDRVMPHTLNQVQ